MKRGPHALLIAAHVIAHELSVKPDQSLRDRLRAAMQIGREHWMITDQDERFRASIGAVLLTATEAERELLTVEMHALRDVSALCEGLPIDPSRIAFPEEPIGLLGLWREVCDEARGYK